MVEEIEKLIQEHVGVFPRRALSGGFELTGVREAAEAIAAACDEVRVPFPLMVLFYKHSPEDVERVLRVTDPSGKTLAAVRASAERERG